MVSEHVSENSPSNDTDSGWKRDCSDCGVCAQCVGRSIQHAQEQNRRAAAAQQEEHGGGWKKGGAEKVSFEMYMQYLDDPTPGNPNHPEREEIRRMYINGARDFICTAKNTEYVRQLQEKLTAYAS